MIIEKILKITLFTKLNFTEVRSQENLSQRKLIMKDIKIILRGIGQVFLQNNALTGLLFLIGIFCNSWILGLGTILGNITSTYCAKIFKYNKEDIENGFYGFNGTLVGIAIFFFFKLNYISIIAVILGSIISTFLMYIIKRKLPAYTSPFVISTWIIIYTLLFLFPEYFLSSGLEVANKINIFESISKGFGQVLFQNNITTGIFFMVGILINSFKNFGYALYGSLLSIMIASILLLPLSAINLGLFSYNAILTSIALKGEKESFFLATFGIILSILVLIMFNNFGFIALTAPFVIATWIVLFLSRKLIR
jgi:urea transporter